MNISRQTNSRTMQLLNPPRVDGIEKSLSTRSCSVQKVGEAPFAFPWRPSSYLLCFSYPSPSLSLSLHLFHSSRFPSSSFFSLSLSHSLACMGVSQLAPRRWYRPTHPLQGCAPRARPTTTLPFSLGNQPSPPYPSSPYYVAPLQHSTTIRFIAEWKEWSNSGIACSL